MSHDGRESPHATHRHSGSIRGQEGLNLCREGLNFKDWGRVSHRWKV
jgi:hypothetical protein